MNKQLFNKLRLSIEVPQR